MKVKILALAAFAVVAVAAEPLPKVWMSAQWRDPFAETIRLCAEQGVDVVEVPSWTTNHCAYVLAARGNLLCLKHTDLLTPTAFARWRSEPRSGEQIRLLNF